MSRLFSNFAVEKETRKNLNPKSLTGTKTMINEFVSYLRTNKGYSDLTCKEYAKDMHELVTFLKMRTNVTRWSEVDKEHLDGWVMIMSLQGLKPATIKRRISCTRSFYQYAWVMGLTKNNPAKYVSTPKKAYRLPTLVEMDKITAAINNERIDKKTRLMIAILGESGMRISELLNLHIENFNPEEKSIRVIGKGNKERKVYYGYHTARLLSETRPQGQLFNDNEREARYNIFCATGATPHTIRHTFATAMLNNGAQLEAISKLLGHKSVKTTEIYAEVAATTIAQTYQQHMPQY